MFGAVHGQADFCEAMMVKPLDQARPYVYWSDRQVGQVRDMDARPPYKRGGKIAFQVPIGLTVEASGESPGTPAPTSPRAQQEAYIAALLADVAVTSTDVNALARYCEGTAHAYWGILALPQGQPSYAAMIGIEPETPGERTMLCLFGPSRNLVGRTESGDVEGWSCSSEPGQQTLLPIGGFDPPDLRLQGSEQAAAAYSAVAIL